MTKFYSHTQEFILFNFAKFAEVGQLLSHTIPKKMIPKDLSTFSKINS